jgi:hypothetical protein
MGNVIAAVSCSPIESCTASHPRYSRPLRGALNSAHGINTGGCLRIANNPVCRPNWMYIPSTLRTTVTHHRQRTEPTLIVCRVSFLPSGSTIASYLCVKAFHPLVWAKQETPQEMRVCRQEYPRQVLQREASLPRTISLLS